MMRGIGLFLLFAVLLSGQNNPFDKPPAEVDAALRARIKEFYDLHVQGQFRKADALVADDTKDYYFESKKPQYLSYEIARIDYFDNFTRAKAVIMCEMYIMMPGFNNKPMKMPTPSEWRLQDGKWFWHVDMDALRNSPFGKMTPGPRGTGPAPPIGVPGAIDFSTDFLFSQVKVNKDEVSMWPDDTAEVIVANGAPGIMEISVPTAPDGVAGKLDKTKLESKQTAVLTIKTAKDAKSGTLNVRVEQTGQLIPIQIKVKQQQQ